MTPTLPPIGDLRVQSPNEQDKVLGLLFEDCPTLTDYVRREIGAASSYTDLIERVRAALLELQKQPEDPRIRAIVAAHPRLGARKVEALSTQSQAEQASLKAPSDAEASALAALNAEYEATFPGLRYVVFVAGRPRDVIMEDMRRRISRRAMGAEQRAAFEAMCDIALDRAAKLQRQD